MKSSIRVENLVKSFGKGETFLSVIDGASFEVAGGELVALVAPSGAGKTTLLMMMGCIEEPTSGKIYLGDELVYDDGYLHRDTRKLRREKIGFIFQAHHLLPFLNIEENVTLLPLANGKTKAESSKIASDLLEYLGIKEKLKAMPSQLSGGQNQRVAIARALANKPRIILADEPTAALDASRSKSVVDLLKSIARKEGVAIVMVTHDDAILTLCDRVLKIEDKKVISYKA